MTDEKEAKDERESMQEKEMKLEEEAKLEKDAKAEQESKVEQESGNGSGLVLQTERLLLRRFRSDDWLALHAYLSLEEVVRYEPYPVQSEGECRVVARQRAESEAYLAVCLRDGGRLIGNLYFSRSQPVEFMTWEIGFVFNPAFQHQGYATEACRALLDHAFANLGAHRVVGHCNPRNESSWRLMERLGMRREGLSMKPVFFHRDADGQPLWHDGLQYAVLDEEWLEATEYRAAGGRRGSRSPIRLETERLILRDHRIEDLESHHRLMSDETAMYWLPDLKTASLEESRRNLEEAIAEVDAPDRRKIFLRIERKDGLHVGEIGYTVSESTPVGRIADLGYFTHASCWGNGYVTEAAREMLRFAFEEDGVCRMSAGCVRDNVRSERVMVKCGMIREAEMIRKVWHDGRLRDRLICRLLREEWKPLREREGT